MTEATNEVAAWAASGAMALTGRADSPPLGPPSRLVPKLRALADRLRSSTSGLVDLDPLALLAERAAISGLARAGDLSCGGGTRLLPTADGWLAVTLVRPDDVDLVPAWLGLPSPPDDLWSAVASIASGGVAAELAERGADLGLPIAALPSAPTTGNGGVTSKAISTDQRPLLTHRDLVVVDLTSLWAGPLCGSLLAMAGATVIKVESTARPDGARLGPAPFFDLLNAGKKSVALDLRDGAGVAALRGLLMNADVVLEASRPRALEQMGIEAVDILSTGRPRVWASITGHGRVGPARNRVAFGDDAAVAGGLVCWSDGQPAFCADAIADPLSGLAATAAVLSALRDCGRWLIDISMAGVAASCAGPTLGVTGGADRAGEIEVAPPRARPAADAAPTLGEHTSAVLAGLSS